MPVRPINITNTKVAGVGFVDYNDNTTSTSPLNLIANTFVNLTNDIVGVFTNTNHLPAGVTSIWNPLTNSFDFSELSIGDLIDIRVDVEVTTLANNAVVDMELLLGIGGAPYSLPIISSKYYKTAGMYRVVETVGIYMGDLNTLSLPAKLRIKTDSLSTVKVNGWYCKIHKFK